MREIIQGRIDNNHIYTYFNFYISSCVCHRSNVLDYCLTIESFQIERVTYFKDYSIRSLATEIIAKFLTTSK